MRPLLEITTMPARYEYEVMRARLEISQDRSIGQQSTRRASVNMRRQAGRAELNTTTHRSDKAFKSTHSRSKSSEDGTSYSFKQWERGSALEAVGDYAEFGSQIARSYKASSIPDTILSQSMRHNRGDLVLMPVSSEEIQYVPASLSMNFSPGDLSADWNVGKARLDFVPGSFKLNFTQYAQINIEYVGGFNYVPRSADPNFQALA